MENLEMEGVKETAGTSTAEDETKRKKPPDILVSLSVANDVALLPLDFKYSPSRRRISLLHGPGSPNEENSSADISPSTPHHSSLNIFRRFSKSSKKRSNPSSITSSLEDIRQDSEDVPDEVIDIVPERPVLEEQIVELYKTISSYRTRKMFALLSSSWVWDNPDQRCADTGNALIHVAAKMGEAKIVNTLVNLHANVNILNTDGDSCLHIAVTAGNVQILKVLLEHKAETETECGRMRLTPLQCAALKCDEECIKHLVKNGADFRATTHNKQTLLHLACLNVLVRLNNARGQIHMKIQEEKEDNSSYPSPIQQEELDGSNISTLEQNLNDDISTIKKEGFAVLKTLLKLFDRNPVEPSTHARLIDLEDSAPTSPGTILHYFCTIGYLEGVYTLLQEPYLCDPNMPNKNHYTPLLIAAKQDYFEIVKILLEAGANPNSQDPKSEMTPLHLILVKYHTDRRNQTCSVIQCLMDHGADPKLTNAAGEAPQHIVARIQDIQMMACFLDYLAEDAVNITDDAGDTLLHYAVGFMDEEAILKIINLGANLMAENNGWRYSDKDLGFEEHEIRLLEGFHQIQLAVTPAIAKPQEFPQDQTAASKRNASHSTSKIPLQEALKNGNSHNYFNALRRCDLKKIVRRMSKQQKEDFQRKHIVAATREVRPDIVRALFQFIREDCNYLHRILLWNDKTSDDDTFSKTALEWAVENNDRLCTTEILHQEYECHKESKEAGLRCLRRQLTGDELLMWTIETFSMFYSKTWFQRIILPIFYTSPLLMSYCSFIYDNYSDIELSMSYYNNFTYQLPVNNNVTLSTIKLLSRVATSISNFTSDNVLKVDEAYNISEVGETVEICPPPNYANSCVAHARMPGDYWIAFIWNVICIVVPLLVFAVIGLIDSKPLINDVLRSINKRLKNTYLIFLTNASLRLVWIFGSIGCAPVYVLYVATLQVYYKFKHNGAKKKNKYRRQLQKFEYLWGVARTAESGLEACFQLLLQSWLLSFDFLHLANLDAYNIASKALDGLIHFGTFGLKATGETEKSLGKMMMSVVSVVMSVASSYRTLKRGAVMMKNTFFIYLSLLCQVLAKILSYFMLFLYQKDFVPTVPVLLIIHFIFVGILKWFFERARHAKNGFLHGPVAFINIFASSFVYVRIVPIDMMKTDKHQSNVAPLEMEHTTFMSQSLFFLLVLFENLSLASLPLVFPSHEFCCLGPSFLNKWWTCILILCLLSWMFHTAYYKYYGHPWADINGPDINLDNVTVRFHFKGEERACTLRCAFCCPWATTSQDQLDETVSNNCDESGLPIIKLNNCVTVDSKQEFPNGRVDV